MNKKQLIVVCIALMVFIFLRVSLAQSNLEVSGIFYEEEGKSYAVVDGAVVEVGSKIDDSEIIEIGKDYVKFKYKDKFIYKKVTGGYEKDKEIQQKSLEQYKNRMSEIGRAQDLIKKEQQLGYLDDMKKSDRYFEAAMTYKAARKWSEAKEALEKSVFYGEKVLMMPMDDTTRANIDAVIQYRRRALY
ncbi:MAG: hypothetical protein HZC15_06800 [Candidatus Omnitrophica bacterium]|nr:hypothetical protein [Candidatus Omnitrophota bacterium]